MTIWNKTNSEKKIKILFNGKIVVLTTEDTSQTVPLFCKCCNFPMRNFEDSISFRKHGVCNKCDERWTSKPNVAWPKGPDKSTVEWKKYIEHRMLFEKPKINFK